MVTMHLFALAGTGALHTLANDGKTWGWLAAIVCIIFGGIMWMFAGFVGSIVGGAIGLRIVGRAIVAVGVIFSALSIAAIGRAFH